MRNVISLRLILMHMIPVLFIRFAVHGGEERFWVCAAIVSMSFVCLGVKMTYCQQVVRLGKGEGTPWYEHFLRLRP